MSNLATQPESLPDWKQEVNRRLAEHKNRKDISTPEPAVQIKSHLPTNSRAAQAAARVAARYANAPSFSELQAFEARAALRIAETATRAALEAQVVAQMALSHWETGPEDEPEPDCLEDVQQRAEPESQALTVRFESDAQQNMVRERAATHQSEHFPSPAPTGEADRRWYWEEFGEGAGQRQLQPVAQEVAPAEPIHANLIQFPRELVATRRIRPRIAGDVCDATGQLSIFEVDPEAISTVPEAPAEPIQHNSIVTGPEWSNIELDEQPAFERKDDLDEVTQTLSLDLAPFSLRLMAAIVDLSLIVGIVSLLAATVARYFHPAISIHTGEVLALAVLVSVSVGYQWLFLVKGKATPGMRYAGISLCTFDDERPTEEELRYRFFSSLVSVLPVGLGLLWAVFDDDHLSWHDRLSHTYQRRF